MTAPATTFYWRPNEYHEVRFATADHVVIPDYTGGHVYKRTHAVVRSFLARDFEVVYEDHCLSSTPVPFIRASQ